MCFFFFFNDTATTEIYTLSLHDALPISVIVKPQGVERRGAGVRDLGGDFVRQSLREHILDLLPLAVLFVPLRSEEHTSELQSQSNLVCRLLLEKKKKDMLRTTAVTLPVG